MKIQDFDFDLPPELIAQFPIEQRASSRMLRLDGSAGVMQDCAICRSAQRLSVREM